MTTPLRCPSALVVDDDATTRLLVTRTLERFGFDTVLEAGDGREAQELLRQRADVGIVVTDLTMPELDGLELLRWGRGEVPDVTWIILSGVETFDAAAEAVRLGAFDFLTKPPQMQQLMVVVRNALEHQALRAERTRLNTELAAANGELAQRVAELEQKSALLKRDLERAEVIQRALLPRVPPALEHYCIHALYRPGAFVGGDLYDVVPLGDRHVGIHVADATGHGVTAAMLSVLFKQRLVLSADDSGAPLPPRQVLAAANRALAEAVDAPGLFLTVAYALVDLEAHTATIASAGHPPVLHVRADGSVTPVRRTGPALGLVRDAHYDEERIDLERGDRLLMHTDGLMLPAGERDHAGVAALLHDGHDPMHALRGLLSARPVSDESDDATALLLYRHAGASAFDNGSTDGDAARPAPAQHTSGALQYGETEDASFLAVAERLVWTHCDELFEAVRAFQQEGRLVVLDLGSCEYLDSTALGTIHELVTGGGIELQRLTPAVREMFDELSMQRALAGVRGEPRPLPELQPLQLHGSGGARRRVVQAHEALSSLSERNRAAFSHVLDAFREES